MARISVTMDVEDDPLIRDIQESLPRNDYGHKFSKEEMFRFLLKRAIRDKKYIEALKKEYKKE